MPRDKYFERDDPRDKYFERDDRAPHDCASANSSDYEELTPPSPKSNGLYCANQSVDITVTNLRRH